MPSASRVQYIIELVQTSSPRSEATPGRIASIIEALMLFLSGICLFADVRYRFFFSSASFYGLCPEFLSIARSC